MTCLDIGFLCGERASLTLLSIEACFLRFVLDRLYLAGNLVTMHWLVCTCDALEEMDCLATCSRLVAAAVQDDEVEDVAAKAEDRGNQHDPTIDITWVNYAFDSLGQ